MGPHLVRTFGATTVRGSHGSPTFAFAILGILGCVLFAHGFVLWRRKRAIEDTPPAKIRSVALGAAELEGIAHPKDPLRQRTGVGHRSLGGLLRLGFLPRR